MAAQELVLQAPVAGRIVPLDQVADPMFALGMIGDGIAIEPASGEVFAPCAGVVVSVHNRGHAIKLRSDDGAEVLVHVGLEAVALRGEGFEVAVAEGQRVAAGELLSRFDPARLAALCGLITTPMVITSDAFHIESRADAGPVAVGDAVMTVAPVGAAVEPPKTTVERDVVLEMTLGFHARPAALLAEIAKGFTSAVRIAFGDKQANAKSPVSLLTLGCRYGSRLRVSAGGADAEAAVAAVADAIASGLGDPVVPIGSAPDASPDAAENLVPAEPFTPGERVVLDGIVASPGIAMGTVVRFGARRRAPSETGADPATETVLLRAAVDDVRRHLKAQVETGRTAPQREIAAAHAGLIDDPELMDAADKWIAAGKSAGDAWCRAIEVQTTILRGLDNARLAERAEDLVDLEQRVLAALAGESLDGVAVAPDAIVVAEDILPSQFMAFGEQLPAGFVVAKGGRTSHVAILAASSGVPMLVAVGADALRIPDGATLVLDAETGRAVVNPSAAAMQAIQDASAAREARRDANRAAASTDCVMADGTRLPVYANVGSVGDALRGYAFGAEGSGLVRTEFLFLDRRAAPTEAEQLAEYQAMAEAMHGKPLTIRMLDIGGDKPTPYLPGKPEENPILGVRGIRMSKRHPEMLRQQFRAILRLAPAGQCRIMLPMIADLAELRWARRLFEEEKAALGIVQPVPLGIMIEVPSAVALADRLAAEADFFSIGTNDLTQYVLAMDRGNPDLAAEVDAFHPAVLRMIAQTVAGARTHDRPVGVCGGLASEVLAAPILIGLGVTSLSATRSGIPDLKAFIRTLDVPTCRTVAQEALQQDTPEAVRALVLARWPDSLPPSLAGIIGDSAAA